VQLPDELLEYSDAVDAMRTLNRVRWVVGDMIGREVEQQEGIPFEWFEVLAALADSPEEALRIGDLATMTLRSKSAMTRLADRIEEAKLIRRDSSETDRRVTNVTLTGQGHALIDRVKPTAARIIIEHFASHITSKDARIVTDVLAKVLTANGVDPRPGTHPGQERVPAAPVGKAEQVS
jgi:DNA-binding MarR family transcriptional regulator